MTKEEFVKKMIREERLAFLYENGTIDLVMIFSLCDDEKNYRWMRSCMDFEYRPHNRKGKVLIIDGLVCNKLTFEKINRLKELVFSKYPQIERVLWRNRKNQNKIVSLTRRIFHEVQYSG